MSRPSHNSVNGVRLASSTLVFFTALLAHVSMPTESATAPALDITKEAPGELDLSAQAAADRESSFGSIKASAKKKGKKSPSPKPGKGSTKKTSKKPPKGKKGESAPPAVKAQGKGKNTGKGPTPAPNTQTASDATQRWPRIAAKLQAMGFKEFVSRAQISGFDQFAIRYLSGKNVTLLVAPDKAWVASKTARPGILLHLLQFASIYGYFTGDALNSLAVGTTLPSAYGTNGKNRQYVFKVRTGFGGRPTDSPGAVILKSNVYAEVSPNGVAWIVHVINNVMSPMVISE